MKKNKDLLLLPDYDPYEGIIYCEPKDLHKYSKEDQCNCFYYDEDEGNHPVEFIENYCTHTHASLAGSPFFLQPWQKSVVRNLFGWKSSQSIEAMRDGEMIELYPRRYGTLFLYIPRKNGKSIFTGALIAYVMFCDGEPGAQIFTAATNGDQAAIIFDVVKKMIQNDKLEDDECMFDQVNILKDSIYLKEDPLTIFKALSGSIKGKHGLSAHFVALDELHEFSDDKLIEPLETSQGARDQPLTSYMTTSDFNRKSPCNEMHQYGKDVRDGIKPDSSFLPVIYEAHKDDDWTCEEVWKKANPNYGISVNPAFLRKECQKAQNLPSLQNRFLRLYLNIKTDADVAWMTGENWDICAGDIDMEELRGAKCYMGLDLASTQDITAAVTIFPDFNNLVLCKFWLPEERKLKYAESSWANKDFIDITPGKAFDTEIAERYIKEMNELYDLKSIAHDPFGATQMVIHLVDEGFDMVHFSQTARYFDDPVRKIEDWTISGKMNHLGNPVLKWMALNAVVTEDSAEHKKLDKKKSANKIDGAVALAMAIGVMISDEGDKESVYEKQGITFL